MTLKELKTTKRQAILNLAAKYGARDIRVFGSVATARTGPDSDVDFLVNLEKGRSLLDLGGLLMDLQELLQCTVDVVTEAGLRERIRQRILTEAVLSSGALNTATMGAFKTSQ